MPTFARAPDEAVKAELLRGALGELLAGRDAGAAALLARLDDVHLDLDERPEDLTWSIFAGALGRRLEHGPAGTNLYLRRFDLSQISLFNLLAERLPIVRLAGAIANAALASLVVPGEPLALLDVGIGTGQQEVALIDGLAAAGRLPGDLHVLAVEPSASSLGEARRGIARAADRAGLSLHWTGVEGVVEDLDEAGWAGLRTDRPLVVNAAFALHHIAGPASARQGVIDRLAALAPRAVVLCEPNSDHLEPALGRRFEHCLWHFGTVFRLIDRLDADLREKAAMKLFFAREIDDIIAREEGTRTERHEPTRRWLERLEDAGLHPSTGFEALAGRQGDGVDVVAADGFAGITIDGELMVSIMAAGTVPFVLEPVRPDVLAGAPALGARASSPAAALRVGDVMATEVPCIGQDATLAQAAELLWSAGASDLVVVDGAGRFAGVLSEGDLVRALLPPTVHGGDRSIVEAFDQLVVNGHHMAPQPIAPLVIEDAIALAPTDDLLLVAREMTTRQIRRLPVVTDDREVVGTISRADLCRALLRV